MGIFEKLKEGQCDWSGRRERITRGKLREAYRGQICSAFDHEKFGFYSNCSEKPLRKFKQDLT